MNSWHKPIHTVLTALALFIFTHTVGAEGLMMDNFFEVYDGQFHEQYRESRGMAKDIASSTATGLLENTRTGKKLNRLKRAMTSRFQFEFTKDFTLPGAIVSPPGNASLKPGKRPDMPPGISFTGKFDNDTKPVLELNTRFAPVAISTRFNPLENELNCEISSQRLNSFMGVKSDIGFVTNGSEAEAVFTIKFEF